VKPSIDISGEVTPEDGADSNGQVTEIEIRFSYIYNTNRKNAAPGTGL
jgi:hypothetical protein